MLEVKAKYDYGKIPPQATELEDVILGAILLEKNAIFKILDIIKPHCFYKYQNQEIFTAALDLFNKNKTIDILTVVEQLKKNEKLEEVGGPFYISTLTERVSGSANIEEHAKLVYEKFALRELIRISSEVQNKSYDDTTDFMEVLEYAQNEMFAIMHKNGKRSRHISEVSEERLNQIHTFKENNVKYTGVPSGFDKIDKITNGWQNSDLILLGARPSMGKTSVVLEFAKRTAKEGIPVDIYSLEMKDTQLYDKTLSTETKIDSSRIRTGNLNQDEWERITDESYKLDKLPIYIDDSPALSIIDFNAKIRQNKTKYKTGLIIVDYLQLMKSPEAYRKGGRLGEVSDISARLKSAAKELNVPIIALSQLSRNTDQRGGDRRPQLSDLKESGSLEQDADIVLFTHRPEFYGIEEVNRNGEMISTHNMIELIFAKNRNGRIGTVTIWKTDDWSDFTEYQNNETKELEF